MSDNSVLFDMSLMQTHIKALINKKKLDDLNSYPHVILIGFFLKIYKDDSIMEGIIEMQIKERKK